MNPMDATPQAQPPQNPQLPGTVSLAEAHSPGTGAITQQTLAEKISLKIKTVYATGLLSADEALTLALWSRLIGCRVTDLELRTGAELAQTSPAAGLLVHRDFPETNKSHFEYLLCTHGSYADRQKWLDLADALTNLKRCLDFGISPKGLAKTIDAAVLDHHVEGRGNPRLLTWADEVLNGNTQKAAPQVEALETRKTVAPRTGSALNALRERDRSALVSSELIREGFLEYFSAKGYTEIPGSPLRPKDDPTLLFINSGMAPLKPYFTGELEPPAQKICNIQTCVRTNDIETIGDTYHLTMFEMMGNWTFGTLSKDEAISNAFLLVRDVFGLQDRRLVATYYAHDPRLQSVPGDLESKAVWQRLGLPDDAIYPLGPDDNFWGPAGNSGPCGPCTELFIDLGVEIGAHPDEKPDSKSGRFIEIWNPGVFMEYNKTPSGEIQPLAKKSLDAGAGVERWAMILQGVKSVYEIDSIKPIMDVVCSSGALAPDGRAARIITDHIRTASVLIAEGFLPDNKEQGYVLRRLIRRAVTQASLQGIGSEVLTAASAVALDQFQHCFDVTAELKQKVAAVLEREAGIFSRTLAAGQKELDKILQRCRKADLDVIPGAEAFRLKDSLGLPLEVIEELAKKNGFAVDQPGYEAALQRQKDQSRQSRG